MFLMRARDVFAKLVSDSNTKKTAYHQIRYQLRSSMQMSMRKLNSLTILLNYPLWCCCHAMYKLLFIPQHQGQGQDSASCIFFFCQYLSFLRIRQGQGQGQFYGVTLLRILFCMCPQLRFVNRIRPYSTTFQTRTGLVALGSKWPVDSYGNQH